MKCKSWSNKINNFVVRRLKSLKNNDQQQQQSSQITIDTIACSKVIQQQLKQPPQQTAKQHTTTTNYNSNNNNNNSNSNNNSAINTMPASQPKEKATAVSLNERNFNELKFKELINNSSSETEVVAVAAAAADIIMATKISTVPMSAVKTNGGGGGHLTLVANTQTKSIVNSPKHYHSHQQTQQQQQHHHQTFQNSCSTMSSSVITVTTPAAATATAATTLTSTVPASNLSQRHSLCGCGNVSVDSSTVQQQKQQQHHYLNNRHISPLNVAMAAQSPSAIRLADGNSSSSTCRSNHNQSASCLRHNYQAKGVIVMNNNPNNFNNKILNNNNNNNNNHNNNNDNKYHNHNNNNANGAAVAATPMATLTTMTSTTAAISTTLLSTAAAAATTTTTTSINTTKTTMTPVKVISTATAAVTPPKKSPKDFIFGKYIGEGSFSMVYLAVDVNTKREYAIKVCEKQQIVRERKQEYIKREREVMHTMTGVPGFVSLSCTFQDTRSLYFVMTYAKNGDLLPYINKVGSFDIDCTRHYAAELVLACEQLHRRNIVHRDLKPENILLDEDMHTLIADFGSAKILTSEEREAADKFLRSGGLDSIKKYRCQSGSSESGDNEIISCSTEDEDEIDSTESSNDTASGGDEIDSPRYRHSAQRYGRGSRYNYNYKRRGSFVGTAQYVSPEVLQSNPITPAADLWALGCIIYQMMSGLPPFRGNNDYMIFKDIIACNLDFPQGFDKEAEDLVKQLLCTNPANRLGAQDFNGCYNSIRSHAFFRGVNFERVRQQTPPPISPFLPDLIKDEEFRLCDHLEPGLDNRQLTRLLGLELGCLSHNSIITMEKTKKTAGAAAGASFNKVTSSAEQSMLGQEQQQQQQPFTSSCSNNYAALTLTSSNKTPTPPSSSAKHSFELTDKEKYDRLELQKSDKWHVFADGEVILKKGFVNKRKGLFARRRMLLLTTGPRLIYIDPVQMIKKGEIPWSPELRAEAKNFKIFFVHTPNRTYYLDDPEGYSLEWVAAIEKMHSITYKEQITKQQQLQQQQQPQKQHQSNSMGTERCRTSNCGNNLKATGITITTATSASSATSSAAAAVVAANITPKITKTSSTISTRALCKSASLLTTPFAMMKTASN